MDQQAFSDLERHGGVTRRDLMGAMVAAPAALALPGAAFAAGPADPSIKLVSLVARKADLSADGFRRHWLGIHGPMARTVPGMDGFILSEAVQESARAAPEAPYAERFDGIAQSWHPAQDVMRAAFATQQGRDWLADGDLFIDRKASRGFFVKEQIVTTPARAEGGVKRTALLVRRQGVTHAQFVEQWTGRHAELARTVPGLTGCVFNRIETTLGGPASPWSEIDGIAEYWWDAGSVNLGERMTSPQWAAWSDHGDQFIDRARSRTIVSLEHVMI
jgi:hypothetical protein